ncbi:MAG TPA: patatin-like phospholipase family protein [Solirubrobacteraceae bacterium]|jgi:predicted patatin/cPLA2 family phospholipase|nr:patatin-like phospholipase family protein [Solirubrobacteraceae bacterium]
MNIRLSMLRRFAADPLLSTVRAMSDDQRGHPVVDLILRRRERGSLPGEREDGRRVALVIEGGGMRGCVSAGMTAAIEQLGLTDSFDEVHGASAGAFNAAFLIAGQASYLTGLYQHGFGNPTFVSARRVLRGQSLFNMDYVVNEVWRTQRPLHTERILESAIELHCTATDVETAEVVDLTDLRDDTDVRSAMLASARLPWLAGAPVPFRGRMLFDATLAESVPVHVPRRTATDMLVLQTRPHGIAHTPMSSSIANLTDRYLVKFNPALVELRRTRSARYDALIGELSRQSLDPEAEPRVGVIRPPAGSPTIGQMENRASAMAAAAGHGFRAAWMALEGSDPEIVSVPRAFH